MDHQFYMPSGREFDVVGFGTNAVDHLIRVPHYPEFNSKVELSTYVVAPGGEVASSMAGLARLGHCCRYIGRFGVDDNGRLGIRSLAAEGVDLELCEVIDGATTQIAYIIIDEGTGERTVIWKRDDATGYSAIDAPTASAGLGRILHLTAHDTDACIAMAQAAAVAGTIVTLDLDNPFPGVRELLPLVNVCLMSSDLPLRITQRQHLNDALMDISDTYGCSVTGVTLGEQGSLLYANGRMIATGAFDVPGGCVDTTGAGDAFRTGFLHGLLNGSDVEESARIANAVAALKCRRPGARDGLPTVEELEDLLIAYR